ncbi:hypothetical protein WR25_11258 [Diploscapter pachys]|uniref:Uncharacterized protein n=1 Tax=Diploscapter pachys TaxID=2018661 RepID=A0A2A2L8D7_9BILA|nr:hypothetical protein WR25_11258 [Diploscapter pachys]
MDRSRMPGFYDSQNEKAKTIIAAIFKEFTDLDAFDEWMKNEEIEFKEPPIQEAMKEESTSQSFDKWMNSEKVEFKEPPIQEAMKKRSTSQSIAKVTADPTPSLIPNNPLVEANTNETSENPNIRDAIAIDIGTSKCRISICKDKYIQIVEHEANRSVPSYVALSEQDEWFVGKMAENYAVCLQNVIYVEDCAKSAVNHIVASMPSSTATPNQPEGQPEAKKSRSDHGESSQQSENQAKLQDNLDKRTPLDDITIKLIDEPIAVAAAYAPRLNIDSKGDVALVFCMGAGYLQIATYFIQEKAQEEKTNWTDWIITEISGIEPIAENFAGDDIDRLIFEEMMEKLTQQVAAIGAAAIVSRTVTVAEKSIDYERVIKIIKEQEEEEEKKRNPPPMPTPAVVSAQDTIVPVQNEAVPAPANDIPISRTPNKIHVEDDKLPENADTSQGNLSEHPNTPYSQPHLYRRRVLIPFPKLKEQIE